MPIPCLYHAIIILVGVVEIIYFKFILVLCLDWSRSSSVRVQPVLAEPAPEHQGSVQPVVAPEPEPKVQVQGGAVQVHTRVHLSSRIKQYYNTKKY